MDPRLFGQGASSSQSPASVISTDETESSSEVLIDNDDEIDFSQSTQESGMVALDEQPVSKMFFIQLKGSDRPPSTIKIFKEKVGLLYDKISKKVMMEPGTFRIDYHLKCKSGKKMPRSLEFSTDQELLEEACEILYCQARSNDTLIIVNDETCKKTKMPSRKKVRSEEIFPKFVAGLGTQNKETYAIMAENSHILSGYLKKLSLVRVMLGDESCCNLLNPADFVCPMVACRGKNPIRLNSWNSLFNFHKHLITHNFDKDKVANALNERYKLLDLNGWHDSNFNYGVTEMIEMLKEKNECSLENMALYTVKEGDKFRGSDSCLNEKLMREFMAGDISALKRIKNQPTILSLARIAAVAEKDSIKEEESDEDED